jgi:hypothetical protein
MEFSTTAVLFEEEEFAKQSSSVFFNVSLFVL